MISTLFFRVALCASATLLLSACVVAPYPPGPMVYPPPGPVAAEMVIGVPPPAPYGEVIPVAPYAGAVWIGGYWGYAQGRHQWVPGRYVQPRPGYHWQAHQWVQGPRGNWHLRGGVWVR
jgi:hypothetical protein